MTGLANEVLKGALSESVGWRLAMQSFDVQSAPQPVNTTKLRSLDKGRAPGIGQSPANDDLVGTYVSTSTMNRSAKLAAPG
jgi:hypothetical protein